MIRLAQITPYNETDVNNELLRLKKSQRTRLDETSKRDLILVRKRNILILKGLESNNMKQKKKKKMNALFLDISSSTKSRIK